MPAKQLPRPPPIAMMVFGVVVAILACLYLAYRPDFLASMLCFCLGLLAFFLQRYLLLGLCIGAIAVALHAPKLYRQTFVDCHFEANIANRANSGSFYSTYHLQADHIVCQGKALKPQRLLFRDYKKLLDSLGHGRIAASATLKPVRAAVNPYQVDYERYLIGQGIRLSASRLKVHDSKPERQILAKLRNAIRKTLSTHLSPQSAAIILAITTGDRSALTQTQKSQLQDTGTAHLLAISGLHVMLVGGLVWLLTQWLWALSWRLSDRLAPRDAGAITALMAITLYALLTGFNIPVQRAWLMASLMIIAWLLRRGFTVHSLLIAAIAVLFFSPYATLSVGFYYSFIATFVVMWAAKLPYSPLSRVMLMQAAIFVVLLPITWFVFGRIAISAFFANLVIIPWLGLWVLPVALFALLISSFSDFLAAPLWGFLDTTTAMLWQTITFFDQLDWTLELEQRPTLAAVMIATAAVLAAAITMKKRYLVAFLLLFLPIHPQPSAEIVLADRRYTSALIHNGETAIVIDPGRRYRNSNQAALWQRYLHANQLQLGTIVLSADKLSRISATKWLKSQFPQANIVTLRPFELPYPATYCESASYDNLALTATKTDDGCQATITWFGHSIALFDTAENAVVAKSTLIWQGNEYRAKERGAIRIKRQEAGFSLTGLRDNKRLWRSQFR